MKKHIIIVAGGKGLRMGGDIPKQFLPVCGKPVLMRTLEAFHAFDASIHLILVLPVSQQTYWKQLCEEYHVFLVKFKGTEVDEFDIFLLEIFGEFSFEGETAMVGTDGNFEFFSTEISDSFHVFFLLVKNCYLNLLNRNIIYQEPPSYSRKLLHNRQHFRRRGREHQDFAKRHNRRAI